MVNAISRALINFPRGRLRLLWCDSTLRNEHRNCHASDNLIAILANFARKVLVCDDILVPVLILYVVYIVRIIIVRVLRIVYVCTSLTLYKQFVQGPVKLLY